MKWKPIANLIQVGLININTHSLSPIYMTNFKDLKNRLGNILKLCVYGDVVTYTLCCAVSVYMSQSQSVLVNR